MIKLITKSLLIVSILYTSQALSSGFDDGARYAFTVSQSKRSVEVLDLEQGLKASSIQFDKKPGGITASKGMDVLIVSHPEDKELTLVNLKSTEMEQHTIPLQLRPDFITLSPLDFNLAIFDAENNILEVKNIHRGQTLAHVEGITSGDLVSFSFDGSQLYVTEREQGQLLVIDLIKNKVAHKIHLAEKAIGLSALTRSIDGSYGFISDANKNIVYVLDLINFEKIAEINVGKKPGRPWGTADGAKIMVPNYDDGTVTVISAITFEKINSLKTVEKPVAINTGWIDTTAAIIGEKGEIAFVNLIKGSVEHRITLDGAPDNGVVTSDSRLLAVSVKNRGEVALFDMKKRQLKGLLAGFPRDIAGITMALTNNYCH